MDTRQTRLSRSSPSKGDSCKVSPLKNNKGHTSHKNDRIEEAKYLNKRLSGSQKSPRKTDTSNDVPIVQTRKQGVKRQLKLLSPRLSKSLPLSYQAKAKRFKHRSDDDTSRSPDHKISLKTSSNIVKRVTRASNTGTPSTISLVTPYSSINKDKQKSKPRDNILIENHIQSTSLSPRACRSKDNNDYASRSQSKSRKRHNSSSSTTSRLSPLPNTDIMNENNQTDEQIIQLRCSVENCDSNGHLSGKFNSHFTQTTCPIYHNMTPKECELRYINRVKGRRLDEDYMDDRYLNSSDASPSKKKRLPQIDFDQTKSKLTTSPHKICRIKTSPKKSSPIKSSPIKLNIGSQSGSLNKLIEQRRKEINHLMSVNNTPQKAKVIRNQHREPSLMNLTPIFDYEMFREAQAKAAEQLQENAKDVKLRYGIKCIELGRYEIDVWYGSPYPEEYRYLPKLYICEYCLKYMTSSAVLCRHVEKCPLKHPPGNEIYRKGNISFFEIDGQQNELYCQNLCLLAKLFLDHKTLYFDVEPFLFYVMTEYDDSGFHIIGYFSKEKNSFLSYNVSCILTLPPYQKQGYGKLLIDLSYLLTKLEGKVGSPEKPLSDMGLISYRSYWKLIILEYLHNYKAKEISIKDISQETGVNAYDIISTLQAMGMLKYWKGKHLVIAPQEVLDDYKVKRRIRDNFKRADPSCLRWTPRIAPP